MGINHGSAINIRLNPIIELKHWCIIYSILYNMVYNSKCWYKCSYKKYLDILYVLYFLINAMIPIVFSFILL